MQQISLALAAHAAAFATLAGITGALTLERLPTLGADARPFPSGQSTFRRERLRLADAASQDLSHFHCASSKAPDGIWKEPKSNDSAKHNICIKGKQVPDVYILGAAKCATTTLAYELIAAGSQCAGDIKEYSFFTKEHRRDFNRDPKPAIDNWLEGMPACDAPHRALLGDFSPEYLSMTDSPGHPSCAPRIGVMELPVLLNSTYAQHASQVNFVVMLREPLARVHSFMHYHRYLLGTTKLMDEVSSLLDIFTPESIIAGHNSIWGSSYGFQMERWLRVFSHSQFYMIPFRAFVDGDANRICRDLVARLRYSIDCGTGVRPNAVNRGQHTALLDETTQEFRDRFHNFMRQDHARLVRHLTEGSDRGMGLALYDGTSGDEEAIDQWLDTWW